MRFRIDRARDREGRSDRIGLLIGLCLDSHAVDLNSLPWLTSGGTQILIIPPHVTSQ